MRFLVFLLALVALCSFGAARALDQSVRPARPNVLLVTIDTLRADRLGCYGYSAAHTPVLDALAQGGVRFKDVTAHVPLTLPAHVSIMTGRYPSAFGMRINGAATLPASVPTLATRFKRAGYATGAFIASLILDRAYGLAEGFDVYNEDMEVNGSRNIALSEMQRPAEQVVKAANAWIVTASKPWFAWVHLFDPHRPYEPPPRFLALAHGRPYDGEIAYADSALKALFDRVDRRSTFVVVTGDHGESLGDHGEEDHGYFLYDATLKVPLIVAGPGLRPRVVDEQVRSVDIAPTIDALAGVASPGDYDGRSLLPLARGDVRGGDILPSYAESALPRLHFGWSDLKSIRVGEWKYIAAPKPELYDLRTDPGETHNIVAEKATVAGRLASELGQLSARAAGGGSQPRAVQPDPEAVRRLQALGYVGSFAPAGSGNSQEDPKDRVADYRAYRQSFNQALGALERNQPQRAVALFKQLLSKNVRAFEAHLYLGNAYAAMNRWDEALGEYAAASQLNPELASVHFEAAKVLSQKGQATEAIAEAREGLTREPQSFYGRYTLGVIYQKAGRYADASAEFTRAVALNDREPRAHAALAETSVRLGAWDVARAECEKMVALGYKVAVAHYNLGFIAERGGDRAEAERHYRLALQDDPAFKPAREGLARVKGPAKR